MDPRLLEYYNRELEVKLKSTLRGEVLFGLGSHYIDGLRHWFGDVEEASGTLLTTAPERRGAAGIVLADADDTFSFTLRFKTGVVAEMTATRNAPYDCWPGSGSSAAAGYGPQWM